MACTDLETIGAGGDVSVQQISAGWYVGVVGCGAGCGGVADEG